MEADAGTRMNVVCDSTDCSVGKFGDMRLTKAGELLFRRIVEKNSLTIKDLAFNRGEQVKFERFLWNKAVTEQEIQQTAFDKVSNLCDGCEHVLCIQDSTEIDLGHRDFDISGLGAIRNKKTAGIHVHFMMVIDAKDDFVLGMCGVDLWTYDPNRPKRVDLEQRRKPIEEKESYRWIRCAETAKQTTANAQMRTFISDRESDLYEYFCRIPDETTHLVLRARLPRQAAIPGQEFKDIDTLTKTIPVAGERILSLRERSQHNGKTLSDVSKRMNNINIGRKARNARLELRFSEIVIQRPKYFCRETEETTTMFLVEVTEIDSANLTPGEEPLHWRLLTTHRVWDADSAWDIVLLYKKRWHIEQLFRAVKRSGLDVEHIELSRGDSIRKLVILALLAAVRVLQLTLARSCESEREVSKVFTIEEVESLKILNDVYQGKTDKQKNPFKCASMAWAYWIIGRAGGWKGYLHSEGPAGPKSIRRGLKELESFVRSMKLISKNTQLKNLVPVVN